MRLRRLALSGIGPFRGEEVIDFDTLTRSGLFLIEGPTGAGKSTIIDAITYALYGSVAGGRESSVDRIRSDLADPVTPSYVELEFDIAGTSYLIRRQPAYSRPKLRGEGLVKENAKQSLRALDGSIEPLTDAREIAAAVQRLLGLSVDHFRKLVVLPQGEFDALLRASPADRFEVLGHLIDDGFMERVQDDLVARAREADARRAAVASDVHEIATTLCSRAAEILGETPDPATLCADDVAAIGARLQSLADEAQARVGALVGPAQAAAEEATFTAAALAQAREAAAAVADLARARDSLPPAWRELPGDRLRHVRTQVAEQIARLAPLEEWERASDQRQSQSAALAEAARQARERVEDVQQRAQTLPQQRTDHERRRADALQLAAALPQHLAEVERLEGLLATAGEMTRLEGELAQAGSAAATALSTRDLRRAELLAAREHRIRLLERRLEHSAADLATRLEAGAACPVCGSHDHPRPAMTSEVELVTDAEVETAEAAVGEAESADASATAVADAAQAAVGEAQSAVDALRGRLADVDPDGLGVALSTAREAAQTAREAASQAADLTQQIADIDAQIAELDEQRHQATAAAATAEARVASDAERISREHEALLAAVGPQTTATQAASLARDEARALDAVLEAIDALAGRAPESDLVVLQAAADSALERSQTLRLALAREQETLTGLTSACQAVEGHAKRWSQARAEAAVVAQATDTAISLGALVSAQSRANTVRLTLQSYAVQRRFRSVLDAATVHLERMSGGHFSFELDESAGRGHAGLGIAVRDQWSGTLRDPKALSGGETFIASLALALGLADVIREESGGVDLQTLFVDEGFGSLDQDSLQQVLDQLDALRSRGRVVGVISHVTEMKDWVHDRVVVERRAPGRGSHLTQPA